MLVVTYLDTRKIAVGKKYIGREMTTVVHLAKSLTPTSITNTHTTYYISHILYYITIYPTIQNNTCYYLIVIANRFILVLKFRKCIYLLIILRIDRRLTGGSLLDSSLRGGVGACWTESVQIHGVNVECYPLGYSENSHIA